MLKVTGDNGNALYLHRSEIWSRAVCTVFNNEVFVRVHHILLYTAIAMAVNSFFDETDEDLRSRAGFLCPFQAGVDPDLSPRLVYQRRHAEFPRVRLDPAQVPDVAQRGQEGQQLAGRSGSLSLRG